MSAYLATHPNRGFTLVELMIAIIIIAILTTIGVPAYQTIMVNSRTAALAAELRSAVNLARVEAVRRGQPVQLCPSSDSLECGGSWTDGWVVRVSAAPDSDPPLRGWSAPLPGTSITQTPIADEAIEFGALGERASGDAVIVLGVPGCFGDRGRRLEVAASGRPDFAQVACP